MNMILKSIANYDKSQKILVNSIVKYFLKNSDIRDDRINIIKNLPEFLKLVQKQMDMSHSLMMSIVKMISQIACSNSGEAAAILKSTGLFSIRDEFLVEILTSSEITPVFLDVLAHSTLEYISNNNYFKEQMIFENILSHLCSTEKTENNIILLNSILTILESDYYKKYLPKMFSELKVDNVQNTQSLQNLQNILLQPHKELKMLSSDEKRECQGKIHLNLASFIEKNPKIRTIIINGLLQRMDSIKNERKKNKENYLQEKSKIKMKVQLENTTKKSLGMKALNEFNNQIFEMKKKGGVHLLQNKISNLLTQYEEIILEGDQSLASFSGLKI